MHERKRIYFFLYIIFLLILVYAIQDFQTSSNVTGEKFTDRRVVHITLLVILVVLGLYYAVTIATSREQKPRIKMKSHVKVALWLMAGWIGFVNFLQNTVDWRMAVHLGLSVLWILTYHFFSHYLRRFPNAWTHVQICIMIMFGFYVYSALYAAYNLQKAYDRIAVVNLAYNVLVFLPWITLLKAKNLRRLGFGLVLLVVIISMKRGAIIVFPVMAITMLLVEAKVWKKRFRTALNFCVLIALFFAGLYVVAQKSEGFLKERFTYEQLISGSGRSDLYRISIDEIRNRTQRDMLLGAGSGSSIDLLGTGIHNEWLEFLYSFGLIGIMLYAVVIITFSQQVWVTIKKASANAPANAMMIAYMLVVGMFGGIYFVHSTFYVVALYGVSAGMLFNENQQRRMIYSKVQIKDRQGSEK